MSEARLLELGKDIRTALYESDAKISIVRMARRMGKTTMLVDWLAETKGNALYFTQWKHVINHIVVDVMDRYADQIEICNRDIIVLKNGSTIRFASNLEEMRGLRLERIAVDEGGYKRAIEGPRMNDDDILRYFPQAKLLVTGSYLHKGSFMDRLIEENKGKSLNEFLCLQYDYRDALRLGLYDEDELKHLREVYSPEAFAQELGPYESLAGYTNEDFLKYLPDYE
jgi:hypothetical protein